MVNVVRGLWGGDAWGIACDPPRPPEDQAIYLSVVQTFRYVSGICYFPSLKAGRRCEVIGVVE